MRKAYGSLGAITLLLGGCPRAEPAAEHESKPAASSTAHAPTSSAAPSASAAPRATPCQSDADCRLVACEGCSCQGVHAKDPDGCAPAKCVAWPCGGYSAVCDSATKVCAVKKSP